MKNIIYVKLSIFIFLIVVVSGTVKHSSASNIQVPLDYSTISEAIEIAENGDTIHVDEGVYLEKLIVTKSLTLVGNNAEIRGTGSGILLTIKANNVINFIIINSIVRNNIN